MKLAFGIQRVSDNLWFGGFGPAPKYDTRWFPEVGAYPFSDRDEAEMQALLLKICEEKP